MTENQASGDDTRPGPPPLPSLNSLFADGKLPAGIAELDVVDRDDLLSLVQGMYQDQLDELMATGPKMLEALPLLVRKAIEKMVSK